jgi:FkbM family methyltransferase
MVANDARDQRSAPVGVFQEVSGSRFGHSRIPARATKTHRSSFGLDLVGPAYLIDSGFEQDDIRLVTEQLSEVDTFVDVGANIGIYTCLAASLGKSVVAIEPLPSNLRCLYQNLKRHGFSGVEVFPMGLSSSPGLLTLRGIGAQASFLPAWAVEEYGFNQHIETLCPTTTLDAILGNRFSGQRLFVKVDVEGFEYEALQGAAATLSMSPAPLWLVECILKEFHPGGNRNFERTFELFFDRGYSARTPQGVPVTTEKVREWAARGCIDSEITKSGFNFFFRKT